jgi:hypothetical protein
MKQYFFSRNLNGKFFISESLYSSWFIIDKEIVNIYFSQSAITKAIQGYVMQIPSSIVNKIQQEHPEHLI